MTIPQSELFGLIALLVQEHAPEGGFIITDETARRFFTDEEHPTVAVTYDPLRLQTRIHLVPVTPPTAIDAGPAEVEAP